MNNTTKTLIVVALIILVFIIWYVMKNEKGKREEGTQISTDSNNVTENTSVDTSTNTSTASNTSTSSSTSSSASISTSTSTSTSTSNQITLSKTMPTYYQYKPTQSGYPNTYGKVVGITFPQGKVLTIVQKWQSQSGDGIYYETTEPVNASILDKVTPHLFIKQTDF